MSLSSLRDTWEREHVLCIENFLDDKFAKELSSHLASLPISKWDVSIHPYQSDVYTFSQRDRSPEFIAKGKQQAKQSYEQGQFAYLFHRYECRTSGCTCPLCRCVSHLLSEEVKKFVRDLTDKKITDSISIFASRYDQGCRLSTHSDTGRGKIAFVLHLSPQPWKNENGGCFHLYTNSGALHKAIWPSYNMLTLFCVEGDGIPHEVKPIAESSDQVRYCVTGWFT